MTLRTYVLSGPFVILLFLTAADLGNQLHLGRLTNGAEFVAVKSNGKWGLAVTKAGIASVTQTQPVAFEFYKSRNEISNVSTGYENVDISGTQILASAHLVGPSGTRFSVRDRWQILGAMIELSREVVVSGHADQGFLSSISFSHPEARPRSDVDYFAPGVLYGSPDHLSAGAIGGRDTYDAREQGIVQIREDRLPAPMFGVHFADGTGLTILDPTPKGTTTRQDSHDTEISSMVDPRFEFGSIGVRLEGGHHQQGFWFPGSEGEVTYRGNTYPAGQVKEWRRRYHPITDQFTQRYRVQFRFSSGEKFPEYRRNAWRWAFAELKPPILWQNLASIQRSIVDVLASQVQEFDGRSGIPNYISATPGEQPRADDQAIMGFTGKNLEAAEFLLADADHDQDVSRASRHRKLGLAIFQSFIRLKMNPPVGEGFVLKTGEPALAIPRDHRVYLRSFGDDMKAALRAYRREKLRGSEHPEWLHWTQEFGDWLLSQQQPAGGFPRAWMPNSGVVVDSSPASSYNPIPFLVLLSEETGQAKYLQAAKRAADFAWDNGQESGQFVGGTIDNPDVLDKEAGTLSVEAYLSLFQNTHDSLWLQRATAAADYAETYIYLWNVPMPADDDNALLHWKQNVPTYGVQLIATGHSLVDDYMAFDVDEYARLARWTGDRHYLEIATLLLHDTKSMIAIPGRLYDLKGPGWQQEHWSMAPVRGFGLHRGWLPWVATSQLKGMIGLNEFDPALFRELSKPSTDGAN
ncbi:MAG TPA: hypothetical protein VKV39_12620 [Candidatus Sulfotelmatobacter sp.]|nr:hypothetical protein [Candidatus Sulfotelmatobacter sp.]